MLWRSQSFEGADKVAEKKLDDIDLKILSALQADGRLTNTAIAQQVGLSATPCLERIKRLERDGFIEGYAARLNPALLGAALLIFVEVTIERTSEDVFENFHRAVRKLPEVLECHMVAGGFDYLLKVRVHDMAAYRTFLGTALSVLPGVRETHTYVVMEEVKSSPSLPLKVLAGARNGTAQ